LTEIKWGEVDAMGFGGLHPGERSLQFDLTEGARTVSLNIASGRVVSLIFMYRVTVASGETNDAHLDRFLVHLVHSYRRATEQLQFSTPLVNSISSWPEQTSRYHAQVEKDTKVSPTIWMGHRACEVLVMDTELSVRRHSWMSAMI